MPRLECASCGKSCRKGKFIACLHVLCVGCIEQNVDFDGSVLCPGCGTKTPSKPGRAPLQWLPNSIVENQQEAVEPETSANSRLCVECAVDTPATAECRNCNSLFCETHGKGHPLSRKSHNHRVGPIVGVGATELTGSLGAGAVRSADHRCAVHPSQKLTHYCMRCKELLCGTCIARGQHTQHRDSVQTVEDAARKAREHLHDKQESCCSSDNGAIPLATDAVRKAIREVNDQTEDASDRARTFVKDRVEVWKKRECELLGKLDQLRSAKLLPLEQQLGRLQECLSRGETVSTILECCQDDADILELCGWLDNAIESQKSTAGNETQPCVRSQLVFSSRDVSDLDSEIMQTGVVADLADCSLVCPDSSPSGKECVVEIKGESAAFSLTADEMARFCLKVEATAPDGQATTCVLPSASSYEVIRASFRPISVGEHTISAVLGGKSLPGSPASVEIAQSKPPVFESDKPHRDLAISNGGRTLVHSGRSARAWRSAFTSPVYGGVEEVKVRIDNIAREPYIFICACNSANPSQNDYHQNKSEVFGWCGCYGLQNCNGGALGQKWQNGDVIHLTLDQDKHTLTGRHERTGVTETLTNVTGELYWYVSLHLSDQQVTIL